MNQEFPPKLTRAVLLTWHASLLHRGAHFHHNQFQFKVHRDRAVIIAIDNSFIAMCFGLKSVMVALRGGEHDMPTLQFQVISNCRSLFLIKIYFFLRCKLRYFSPNRKGTQLQTKKKKIIVHYYFSNFLAQRHWQCCADAGKQPI